MNWILQQPLVIIVAGLVAELILFLVLKQTGKRWVIGAMVAVAVLFSAALFLERAIVTPEEAIRAKLYEIAADVQRNNLEAVIAHISRRAPKRQDEARDTLKLVQFQEVTVKRISNPTVADSAQSASVRVRVKAVGTSGNLRGTDVRELDVDFILEDNTWKVRDWKDLGNPLLPER